ncbi:unnamed protein product, partial [Ectocarpus sp. 12 AP-2014]
WGAHLLKARTDLDDCALGRRSLLPVSFLAPLRARRRSSSRAGCGSRRALFGRVLPRSQAVEARVKDGACVLLGHLPEAHRGVGRRREGEVETQAVETATTRSRRRCLTLALGSRSIHVHCVRGRGL